MPNISGEYEPMEHGTRGEAIDFSLAKLPEALQRGAVREVLGGLYDTGATCAGHRANEIVSPKGADRTTPGGLTRLEAATLERWNVQSAAVRKHDERVAESARRLKADLEDIEKVFRERLFIA